MSNIDKQALREAAEKALPAMKRLLMMPNDELFDEALLNVDGDVDAANAFNLLSGPETMLALLDELEAAEKLIAELELKLEAADKLQDSAFRHGLQHGFSYGQTDNQAGFEQAIQAYGQQWKGE
ncbi:ead/Ea22-like family protein [Citrobacter telavivensis]|uniref:Ead/Ea22-like family protein n=1 Tax=Citrobacter telavivensis TaxID=2653932 RepID=A0A6L5EIT8_9ENTR|nr:ead/Ea22-like family protein [Citrobacter telavivensis]MPQ54623.1 ead/Ea22-like family protein [Citrobacter telavivensis]QFS70950.1 ead/Ea22-like family protein [Citrobacter telavivensis]